MASNQNLDWKSFGGHYEKNTSVSFNNLTTDNLIMKKPYNGLFTVSGDLIVKGRSILSNDLTFSNVNISGDMDVTGNLVVHKSATINESLIVKDISLKDIHVKNSLFLGPKDNVIFTVSGESNNNLGINVKNPQATIDISSNVVNTLKMTSSQIKNVNILSINRDRHGITSFTDISKSAIQFWNSDSSSNRIYNNGGDLDTPRVLQNSYNSSSISSYLDGIMFIDCSNLTIGRSIGLLTHSLNETLVVKNNNSNNYLFKYYENSNYVSGNTLSLISNTSSDSNASLHIITPSFKGVVFNGGSYLPDNTRSFSTLGLFDICGEIYPAQTVVSGNNRAYLKTTTGINTISPVTETYALCINGPTKITNDQIEMILNVDFEIYKIIGCKSYRPFSIITGSRSSYNSKILYTNDGGKNWNTSTYTTSQSGVTNTFSKGFIDSSSSAYLIDPDTKTVIHTIDNCKSWTDDTNFISDYNFKFLLIADKIIFFSVLKANRRQKKNQVLVL